MRHPPPAICQNLGGGGGGGGGLVGSWGGGGRLEGVGGGRGRLEGRGGAEGGGGGSAGGGGPKVRGPTRDPLLPHAYHQVGCVSRAGLGNLLVAVVKQGLQMGRCVHSGCGDLSLCNK